MDSSERATRICAGRDDTGPAARHRSGMDDAHVLHQTSTARAGSKVAALAVLATAQLVIALDYSIVNVALPDIGRSLHFPGGRSSGSSALTP
jgi:hypothetical protein